MQDPQERFSLFKTYLDNPSLLSEPQTHLIRERLGVWAECLRVKLGNFAQKIMKLPIFHTGRIGMQSSWGWENLAEVRDLEICITRLAEAVYDKNMPYRNPESEWQYWIEDRKNDIWESSFTLLNTFHRYNYLVKVCKLVRPDRLDTLGKSLGVLIAEVLDKLLHHNFPTTVIPPSPDIPDRNLIDDLLRIFKEYVPDLKKDPLFIVVTQIVNTFQESQVSCEAVKGRYYRLKD